MNIAVIGSSLGDLNLDSPIDTLPLIFLDTETTGLDPRKGAKITELAVLDWQSTLIDVASLEPDDVGDYLAPLRHYFSGTIVVGHNISFDLRHLSAAFEHAGEAFPDRVLTLDTIALAMEEPKEGLSLRSIAQRRGLDTTELHTARRDAEICRELLTERSNESARSLGARYLSVHGRLPR